jgi:hypothetical protein
VLFGGVCCFCHGFPVLVGEMRERGKMRERVVLHFPDNLPYLGVDFPKTNMNILKPTLNQGRVIYVRNPLHYLKRHTNAELLDHFPRMKYDRH